MMVKKKHGFSFKTKFLLSLFAVFLSVSVFVMNNRSVFAAGEGDCYASGGTWRDGTCDCGSGRTVGADGRCVPSDTIIDQIQGGSTNAIYKKSLFLGAYECYTNHAKIGNEFTAGSTRFGSNTFFNDNDIIYLPTGFENSLHSSREHCEYVMSGFHGNDDNNSRGNDYSTGLLEEFNKSRWKPNAIGEEGMQNLGLIEQAGGNNKKYVLKFQLTPAGGQTTEYTITYENHSATITPAAEGENLCNTTSGPWGSADPFAICTAGGYRVGWAHIGNNWATFDMHNRFALVDSSNSVLDAQGTGGWLYICNDKTHFSREISGGIISMDCGGTYETTINYDNNAPTLTAMTYVEESSEGSGKYKFSDPPAGSFWNMVKSITGKNVAENISQFYLTPDEQKTLYMTYINGVIHNSDLKFSSTCYAQGSSEFQAARTNGNYMAINNGQWCLLEGMDSLNQNSAWDNMKLNGSGSKVISREGKFAVVTAQDASKNGTKLGATQDSYIDALREVIRLLMALDEFIDAGQEIPTVTPTSSSEDSVCLKENAAGAVSWAICPTMEGLAEGSDGIYALIKDYLRIDADLLKIGDGHDGTYQVWQYFVGFANVFAVIFLLFIVFSQVTGYGINNYGVKKALPKLLVMVLLINLSFLICQLAVDLSNVIGQSLSLLLNSVAKTAIGNVSNLTVSAAGVGEVNWIQGFAIGGATMGSLVPTIITVLMSTTGWIAVILIIFAVLAMFIAVLAVFVMLAAREILVVALVALSPLAFACNIFPGTEKIFKRWFDIFKGMLLIFPIASGLYGVGCIIQAIIISSQGGHLQVWESIIAALAPMAPFVALPGLLRSSLNAVGNIGTTIQGLGNRARGGLNNASRAVQNSERGREAQRQRQMNRDERIVNRLRQREANGATLSDYNRRRLNRHAASFNAATREDIAAQNANPELLVAGTAAYEAMAAGVQNKERESRIGDRVMLLQNNNPDNNTLFTMYQDAINSGDNEQAVAIARYAGRSKPTANQFADYIRTNGGVMNREVAREIMTGASAGTYKAATGTLYEYASQIHTNDTDHQVFDGGGNIRDYADWATADLVDAHTGEHYSNISLAVEHNMSKPEELAGQGRSTLSEVEHAKNGVAHSYTSGANTRNVNFTAGRTFTAAGNQALERNAAGALALENVDNTKEQNYRNIANGRGTIAQENAAAAADIAAARQSDTLAGTYRDGAGNIRRVVRNADGTYSLFDGSNVQVHIRRGPTNANDVDSNLRGGGYTKI